MAKENVNPIKIMHHTLLIGADAAQNVGAWDLNGKATVTIAEIADITAELIYSNNTGDIYKLSL